MAQIVLFDNGTHRNVLLEDHGDGVAVPANQHVIVDGDEAMILDPGGHKVFSKVLSDTLSVIGRSQLTTLFLSHQDPDIVAAVNGWLMSTDATAYVSVLWTRFVAHFGLSHLVMDRMKEMDDEGMIFELGDARLPAIPAHFLHSAGNFQLYDPVSKILYTGDLGAAVTSEEREVSNFEAHIPHMEGFHRRYMGGGTVMRAWAKMARTLDIEIIAPQHGAFFRGEEMVNQFIDWVEGFECGVDYIHELFIVPTE